MGLGWVGMRTRSSTRPRAGNAQLRVEAALSLPLAGLCLVLGACVNRESVLAIISQLVVAEEASVSTTEAFRTLNSRHLYPHDHTLHRQRHLFCEAKCWAHGPVLEQQEQHPPPSAPPSFLSFSTHTSPSTPPHYALCPPPPPPQTRHPCCSLFCPTPPSHGPRISKPTRRRWTVSSPSLTPSWKR